MAEFIIVLGFFIVLIIEQVVLDFKERWKKDITIEAVHAVNIDANHRPIPHNSHDEDETSRLLENPGENFSNGDSENTKTTNRRQCYRKNNRSKNYGSTTSSNPCKGKSLETTKEIEHRNNNDTSR